MIRPARQPEGDLLPGADTRRLAVQGFVEASSPDGLIVTVAPLDAFALRLDLGQVTFEALGNDMNEKEVTRDQGGITDFASGTPCGPFPWTTGGADRSNGAGPWLAACWPSLDVSRRASAAQGVSSSIPRGAIATCFKPADDERAGGVILRLWEVSGRTGPIQRSACRASGRAFRTDLLERDLEELPVARRRC